MTLQPFGPPAPPAATRLGLSAAAAATPPAAGPGLVYLARLGMGSRRAMRSALVTIAQLAAGSTDTGPATSGAADPSPADQVDGRDAIIAAFPWHLLRYQHTQAIRAALTARYAPATTNKHLAALRGVLKEAWRLELMSAEDYHRAADVDGVRGTRLAAGRHVEPGEITALAGACRADPGPAGARDGALLGIAFAAGLRVSELVGLQLADINTETGELTVRSGKGDKQRTGYLPRGALAAVTDWLELRGTDPGALFCPVAKAGAITIRPLTSQAVYARVLLRARQAGLARPVSPHDGRRTWIGDLLDSGADLAVVQQLAGHASVQTTARYDRRGERAKRHAAGLLHFPWAASTRPTTAQTTTAQSPERGDGSEISGDQS